MNDDYIQAMQIDVDKWKSKFQVLYNWTIIFSVNEDKWSMIEYNTKNRAAKIYACDIDDEEAYILSQVLKIAFIECDTIEKRLEFIEDLTTQMLK
jgi:hypothetical protein